MPIPDPDGGVAVAQTAVSTASPTAAELSSLVTIVVAARNSWPELKNSLRRHEAPVVVVDNGSTDGTPERIRAHFPDVRVIELADNAGAAARNVGVDAAQAPYIAFADDDSWWSAGSLARAVELMERYPRMGLLASRVLVGEDERLDPTSAVMAGSPLGTDPDLPGPSILGFVACGAVVRRTAFQQAGGFDDVVFFMGEEERLALDLAACGWGLAYVADVTSHHHPSATRDRRDRHVRIARNRVLTAVLRRPWPIVMRTVARTAFDGPAGRRALAEAAPALRRALRARRTLPAAVEAARRRLD